MKKTLYIFRGHALGIAFGIMMLAIILLANSAGADPVQVVTYDVEQTPMSGFGCWSHTYNGAIVDTGRTVSGSICGGHIANYNGGSGTLNDGILSTSTVETHLFTTRNADDGLPITPKLTLHLATPANINEIDVFGGYIEFNAIPGALNGVTVEIGGVSQFIPITPVGGRTNVFGIPFDGMFDLRNTPLATIKTDTIVLKDFTSVLFGSPFDQFSLTEVTVDGIPQIIEVSIDIKPGSFPNSINLGSGGTVPVAIFSTPGTGWNAAPAFDATTVDPATVTLAGAPETDPGGYAGVRDPTTVTLAGAQVNLKGKGTPIASKEDVNNDGLLDLVVHVSPEAMQLSSSDTEAVLEGQTFDGLHIRGSDSVRIVPP